MKAYHRFYKEVWKKGESQIAAKYQLLWGVLRKSLQSLASSRHSKLIVVSLQKTQTFLARKTKVQDGILDLTPMCYLQGNQINKDNSDISNQTTKNIGLGLYLFKLSKCWWHLFHFSQIMPSLFGLLESTYVSVLFKKINEEATWMSEGYFQTSKLVK